MSLQRKFVALLTVLALAVFVNLGASIWTLSFLQREFVRPLNAMQLILPRLAEIKRAVTHQARALTGAEQFPIGGEKSPSRDGESKAEFDAAAARIDETILFLENTDQYQSLVGISTTRNLNARARESEVAARSWFTSGDESDLARAVRLLLQVHDLIERMEANVTESAASLPYNVYAPRIRYLLLVDVLASLSIVVLAFALGVTLVRRWVARPVGLLREAAEKLGKGDFTHRVPVTAQDELGALSAEVNHMAGMISTMQNERIERERLAAAGEVVQRLAHNLRNPLAGIRSLAELTRSQLPPDDPTRENQSRIIQSIDRFERWLAQVLSATSPLRLSPESVPVVRWINGVVEPLRAMAASTNLKIDVDTSESPELARFDPRHLEQAVVGMITNAIQASPAGGHVQIKAQTRGESWKLSIADQGPGVPPGLWDKIFRPYFTTKREGTGIGLAVAKQVAELHSGRIWVEPASGPEDRVGTGPGARFVLELPLAGPSEVANTGQSGQVDGAKLGQDSHSRRRAEPPVFHRPDSAPGGA